MAHSIVDGGPITDPVTGPTGTVLQCALDGYARALAALETVLRAIELAPDDATRKSLVDVAVRAVALSRSARKRIPVLFEQHVAKLPGGTDEERAAMRRELAAYLDACGADLVEHERGIFDLAAKVEAPGSRRQAPGFRHARPRRRAVLLRPSAKPGARSPKP